MSAPGQEPDEEPRRYRSGFACLVGRPNAGKTTLTNAMVGEKVGIVSNRPQTTRHAIRGVVHRSSGQLVLVDTPGLHKPRSLPTARSRTAAASPVWSAVPTPARPP